MSKEELVSAVKRIVTLARSGDLDGAYAGYRDLFTAPWFMEQRPEDQRQALRLMILAKNAPRTPTPLMSEAHRAAVPPLTELVSIHQEPADHEMLGICHVILGNAESASTIFRAGLALERARNPSSDLCGELMKRISLI
ncbi:MAG: hypothetical protein QM820_49210 [Minicystis sp.]